MPQFLIEYLIETVSIHVILEWDLIGILRAMGFCGWVFMCMDRFPETKYMMKKSAVSW